MYKIKLNDNMYVCGSFLNYYFYFAFKIIKITDD